MKKKPAEKKPENITFGKLVAELREQKGMTQKSLAKASDMAVQSIAKLEQGWADPVWSTVQKLAAALGVNCSAFESVPSKPKKAPKK